MIRSEARRLFARVPPCLVPPTRGPGRLRLPENADRMTRQRGSGIEERFVMSCRDLVGAPSPLLIAGRPARLPTAERTLLLRCRRKTAGDGALPRGNGLLFPAPTNRWGRRSRRQRAALITSSSLHRHSRSLNPFRSTAAATPTFSESTLGAISTRTPPPPPRPHAALVAVETPSCSFPTTKHLRKVKDWRGSVMRGGEEPRRAAERVGQSLLLDRARTSVWGRSA